MDALKKLSELHDYVKKNYEQGNYDSAKTDYQQWADSSTHRDHSSATATQSDYQMGFEQAVRDHEQNRGFRHYPESLVKFGNTVTDNQMVELSEFIKGYHEGEKHVQES
ncbi:hypothetical protein KTE19_07060 [Lentilactobacillus sp. IMAU92037]|uniref:hypothetical protein n=1 Tax=Lentilactobacillus TaxID=2767893 RepID=UPI001C273472|nr:MULTISPECIES: hypothetical protein [Lentilactobacillus]MBU9789335.1 hypothetical protein [Lentilactobacillus dabitei]MBV0930473.1 hypothetical protein [Lentilactobacillus dabitei]MDM7516784.1 hypothetical protein [Lentilactobacillus sp. TOM.63]